MTDSSFVYILVAWNMLAFLLSYLSFSIAKARSVVLLCLSGIASALLIMSWHMMKDATGPGVHVSGEGVAIANALLVCGAALFLASMIIVLDLSIYLVLHRRMPRGANTQNTLREAKD